ncbi:MAG: hypothetical protein ACFFBP_12155 [Promethearchaeota archaeon]
MNRNLTTQSKILNQSMNEYQALSLHRPEDKDYVIEKKKQGLILCYLYDNGELEPWDGEKVLKFFNDVALNIKDDSFKSRFKKMRVAKNAPTHWKFYYTNERIVATIPYGKTLKIGDIVDFFKTTVKRRAHKGHFISGFFPHSMLAGIVIRSKEGKPNTEHIAFVYKKKLLHEDKIVNYTLYFFNYGSQAQSENFCLRVKNLACNLQLKLLPLVKSNSLLPDKDILKLKSEITENLNKREFETRISTEKFRNYIIKTLYVGGIPFPIFPREHI